MNYKFFLVIVLAIFNIALFAGCVSNQNDEAQVSQVVLIFKDAPLQSSRKGIVVGTSNILDPDKIIGFVDSSGLEKYFCPRTIGYDTLVVPTFYGVAEVSHLYQVHETIFYLFRAGDTILFTYDNDSKRPYAKSLLSPQNTQLYNLGFNLPDFLQANFYSTLTTLGINEYRISYLNKKGLNTTPPPLSIKDKLEEIYIDLDSLELIHERYLESLTSGIDSLIKLNLIPKQWYDYYTRRVAIEREEKRYRHNNRLLAKDTHIQLNREEFYYNVVDDTLAYQLSYQNHVAWNCLPIIYKQNTNRYLRKYTEILTLFDSLSVDKFILPLTQKVILRKYLNTIIESSPAEIEKRYIDKYVAITGDTLHKSKSVNSPNIIDGYSNDLLLISLNGDTLNYNDMLSKYKGKVIYVDFWASWCSPCRDGMPVAKVMRGEYRNRDIVFVYLALNDNMGGWRSAVKQYKTDVGGDNYFISNSKDNQFIPELKLRGIPFMIIYDKQGKLKVVDAPHPNSKEIRNLLDDYIAQ